MATMPTYYLKHIITTNPKLYFLHRVKKFQSLACLLHNREQQSEPTQLDNVNKSSENNRDAKVKSFFPKRGQNLELVCESLDFKGKGVCKVEDSGFIVMCDRALPGERFIRRVTHRKGSYAEVTKVKTISPHWDIVDAPCEYSSYCGGCRMQNLSYEAQLRAKEQQVRELIVHVGRFSDKTPEFLSTMKVLETIQECWRHPNFSLTPYDTRHHTGFLKHLMLRTGRNPDTAFVMDVNRHTLSRHEELVPTANEVASIPNQFSLPTSEQVNEVTTLKEKNGMESMIFTLCYWSHFRYYC